MTAADVVLAIAAIVQASTAVAIWRLTKRLATATETYAEQTKLMVDEMSEQRKHQETADIRAASERVGSCT